MASFYLLLYILDADGVRLCRHMQCPYACFNQSTANPTRESLAMCHPAADMPDVSRENDKKASFSAHVEALYESKYLIHIQLKIH